MPNETTLLRRFGRQLRTCRKQMMISREELGSRIRLSVKDIEELEAGRVDPGLSTILRIAQALNISPEGLLIPSGKHDSEYYTYRSYILRLLNDLSKKELKRVIGIIHSIHQP